jgi:Domain of unknown function (DUF4439)
VSARPSATDELVAAWQAALAGEHAAVWAYGRAAAELSGGQRTTALDLLDAHRTAREGLRARLHAAGARPVEAAAAYLEPFPVTAAASGRRLLAHVEDNLAATYADLAAGSTGDERASAVGASVAAARRSVAWGGPPTAFPGAG